MKKSSNPATYSRVRAYRNRNGSTPSQEGPQNVLLEAERQLPRRRYAKLLHEMLEDDDLEGALAAIRRGLIATKCHWDGVAQKMVEAPDYKIQIDAAKTVLSYREGIPVQKELIITETFETLQKTFIEALSSPETSALIQSELLRSKASKNWDSAPPTV